jgi:hypothetical protein
MTPPPSTIVIAADELLPATGSFDELLTLAMADRAVPAGAITFTSICIVSKLPAGNEPKENVTDPGAPTRGAMIEPLPDAEKKVVPAGKSRLTTTSLAVSGPELKSVTV